MMKAIWRQLEKEPEAKSETELPAVETPPAAQYDENSSESKKAATAAEQQPGSEPGEETHVAGTSPELVETLKNEMVQQPQESSPEEPVKPLN